MRRNAIVWPRMEHGLNTDSKIGNAVLVRVQSVFLPWHKLSLLSPCVATIRRIHWERLSSFCKVRRSDCKRSIGGAAKSRGLRSPGWKFKVSFIESRTS